MSHCASVRRTLAHSVACLMMLATLPALSACSVGMAMSGKEDPNVSVLRTGSTRLDVERELGAPRSSRALSDGRFEATYQYELGNEPSAGRAVAHGAMDVLTLGLWEVVGTPVEATQGEEYEVTVVYDSNNVVQSVTAADDYGSVSGSQVSTADGAEQVAMATSQSHPFDGIWTGQAVIQQMSCVSGAKRFSLTLTVEDGQIRGGDPDGIYVADGQVSKDGHLKGASLNNYLLMEGTISQGTLRLHNRDCNAQYTFRKSGTLPNYTSAIE